MGQYTNSQLVMMIYASLAILTVPGVVMYVTALWVDRKNRHKYEANVTPIPRAKTDRKAA
jgi:hypothetical protein